MEATYIFINRWMDTEDIYLDYYLTIKSEIMPFAATRMDLEIIIVSEASQTDKHKYMIALSVEPKKWYKWMYLQNRKTHRLKKHIYGYQRERGERIN